jgi:hypothetical protein
MEPLTVTPSFTKVEYRGGKTQQGTLIYNTKELTLDVKAKVLKRNGVMSHKHVGTPIHRSYVTEFHSGVAFGFDSDPNSAGHFIYEPENGQVNRGEYDDTSFKLILWQETADSIELPASPSYP